MLQTIDPTEIADKSLSQKVEVLLNLIEKLHVQLKELQEENQGLRDENNRLKGEQGKPNIKAKKPRGFSNNYSSEKERKLPQNHSKGTKKSRVKIDTEEILEYPMELLPMDAQFKGYEEVIIQDITLGTDKVLFRKQNYYSHSTRKTSASRITSRLRRRIWSANQNLNHQFVLWGKYDPRQTIRVSRGHGHLHLSREFVWLFNQKPVFF